MWFKNARLYTLPEDFQPDMASLEAALQAGRFQPCGRSDKVRAGWVSPLDASGQGDLADILTHALGPCVMFCLRKEEKILPASVVNDAVNEQVREIEAKQDRKVYRKEKLQLKDDAIAYRRRPAPRLNCRGWRNPSKSGQETAAVWWVSVR